MANESPLIHDGAQCVLGFDARNSTITGTTLYGPSGSGQYCAVVLGTTARTLRLPTSAGEQIYGVLQNKGSTGSVADVGIFGITKAVAAFTASSDAITPGVLVRASTLAGGFLLYSTVAGTYPAGIALTGAANGDVFTMALYGFGRGGANL